MSFNFDTRNTIINRALKISEFPLCRYASLLAQLFFYATIISSILFVLGFLGAFYPVSIKASIICLALYLFFLELDFFVEYSIKKPVLAVSLAEAMVYPDNYNLAEFLSLKACRIIQDTIALCKKKRLSAVLSEALFYCATIESQEVQTLLLRLGIEVKKLKTNLKNYLEKQQKQSKFNLVLSESFQKTILEAARVSLERNHQQIGEKELLVALSKHDTFFKKVLIDQEVKDSDVQTITMWLDTLEERIAKSKKFWLKENLANMGSLAKDWAAGFTVTLDQFSINWTEIKRKSVFREIVGHQKEVDELERVLAKSNVSNALIVGDVGSGRKSIVEALAQRCYLQTGLPALAARKVIELDMVALLSRIQDIEHLETTIDQIFQEVAYSGNVILVIDQLDSFADEKVQKLGQIDITKLLSKYLPLPDFHFVGITSFEGLHKKLESNPAFLEYFRKIEVSEISELETIQILQNIALEIEHRDHLLISYPAVRETVNLTGRYFPSTPFPKKAIDMLYEAAVYVKSIKEKVVLPKHIAKLISEKTQIPVGKMEFKEKSVLMNLENLIHEKIVNQEEAVSEIAIALRRARAGIASKKRPMGVFLFLGPTGVGKTETAKALAEIYFNGQDKMIRIDMSEFQSVSDIPRLLGAVSPVEQQGLLTTPVRENPFSLILLDEIEKGHPNILNLFLQVFDEGHLTDGQGRKVIFTNTIIICTSNAGANTIFESLESGSKIEKSKLLQALFEQSVFKPEFINRFDAAVLFHPLTKENLMDIAQLMLLGITKNLQEKEITFTITESLKEKIVSLSYKPEFGAREMRRVVQDNVENSIAKALLSDTINRGDIIEINPENFAVEILSQNS